jgi:membrane-associated phospholipid phosphatase
MRHPTPPARLLATLALAVVVSAPAGARAERVPLGANFAPLEQGGVAMVVTFDLLLVGFQGSIVASRTPAIGAPPDFDRSVSESLYRGPGAGKWLGGVPDTGGLVVAPIASFAVYGADELVFALRGQSLTGDENPDHKLLALTEAFAVSLGLDEVAKVYIGRERPAFYFGRPDAGPRTADAQLSFFSGHSTASFCLAAFVGRDVGDWLASHPLADAAPATRLWVGRVLPAATLYGLATVVGVSRIIDQQHYLSDVLVGAAVGATVGNVVYALHFDENGQPRRHFDVQLAAFPAGLALSGRF